MKYELEILTIKLQVYRRNGVQEYLVWQLARSRLRLVSFAKW